MKLYVIAAFDFSLAGVALKAGESLWLEESLACDLASKGCVNIPRPQPATPSADKQPVKQ